MGQAEFKVDRPVLVATSQLFQHDRGQIRGQLPLRGTIIANVIVQDCCSQSERQSALLVRKSFRSHRRFLLRGSRYVSSSFDFNLRAVFGLR